MEAEGKKRGFLRCIFVPQPSVSLIQISLMYFADEELFNQTSLCTETRAARRRSRIDDGVLSLHHVRVDRSPISSGLSLVAIVLVDGGRAIR